MDGMDVIEEFFYLDPAYIHDYDSSQDCFPSHMNPRKRSGHNGYIPSQQSSSESFEVQNFPSNRTITGLDTCPAEFVHLSSRASPEQANVIDKKPENLEHETNCHGDAPSDVRQRHLDKAVVPRPLQMPSMMHRSREFEEVAWLLVNDQFIPVPRWFQAEIQNRPRLFQRQLAACRLPTVETPPVDLPNCHYPHHQMRLLPVTGCTPFDLRVYHFDSLCSNFNIQVPETLKPVSAVA